MPVFFYLKLAYLVSWGRGIKRNSCGCLLFFLLALLCATSSLTVVAADVPPEVRQALIKARMPLSGWAAVVVALEGGKPVFSLAPKKPMNPASLMKVPVSLAALDVLGSDFTWETAVWRDGDTLYFQGGGDPHLVLEDFWRFLSALRARGVDRVGHLVIDTSLYEVPPEDVKALFDEEPMRAYHAQPDPLLINFNAIEVEFIPDAATKEVRVRTVPPLARLRIKPPSLGAGPCGDWRSRIAMQPPDWRSHLVFKGEYPASCGEQVMAMRAFPLGPGEYFAGLFNALWPIVGGSGEADVREGTVPANATLVYRHRSATLSEQIRFMNKFSNNVMAEQIFLHLSARSGSQGSREASRATLLAWLEGKGIDPQAVVLSNGSGLSRDTRISAKALGILLQQAWRSTVMPDFVASLPRIGVDGSMKKRLLDGDYQGAGYIKTGRLTGVSGIAGYMQSAKGGRYVVVSILNAAGAEYAQEVHDSLLRWVYSLP